MTDNFVIDQVSWHTKTLGNPESRDHIIRRFRVIANFLTVNSLSLRDLTCQEADIDESFNISSADLTDDGLSLMRAAYDKWLQKVDEGMPPEDVSLFIRALKRLRSH